MSALPQLKESALALEDRVAVLTFQRNDVRNALTGTEITADMALCHKTADHQEALTAFFEKRRGNFKGA